jgi:ribosomal protein S17
MSDPVEVLMEQSISVAREYKKLHQQLSELVERRQRTNRHDPLREDLERQIQALTAEMRELCWG